MSAARKYSATPLYEAEVLFDYDAVEPTELTVQKGQIVAVREINDSGWCLVKIGDGRSGWVPLDYLDKLDDKPPAISTLPVVPEAAEHVPLPPAPEPNPADDASAAEALKQLNLALGNVGANAAAPQAAAGPKENCAKCKTGITSKYVMAKDRLFHTECFSCSVCSKTLAGQPYIEKDDQFFCEDDYYRKFNPPCAACNDVIKGRYITALNQAWHPEHFVCTECNQPFQGDQFRKHDNKPYCDEHFNKMFGTTCSKCSKNIEGQVFEALNKKFHLDCFTCEAGNHAIGEQNSFHLYEDKVYCAQHFDDMFVQKCTRCTQPILAEYIKVQDNHYHPECWRCANCDNVITRSNCEQFAQKFVCQGCYAQMVQSSKGATREAPKAPAAAQAAAPVAAPVAAASTAAAAAVRKTSGADAKVNVQAGTAAFGNNVASAAARIIQQAQELKTPTRPSAASVDKRLPKQESDFVSYALLKSGPCPEWVDTSKKEQYLDSAMFEKLFKMSKEEFAKQKDWKQKKLKQELGLW